jgi:capsid protein
MSKYTLNTDFTGVNIHQLGYDAIADKGRRRSPSVRKKSEHKILNKNNRNKLYATVYDLIRNDQSASWAYNKFLDYTTSFHFQMNTDDDKFNDDFEFAVNDWGKKQNCDIAGRHSLKSMIRLFGSGMCLDGDSLMIKTRGYKLQGVEADRIAKPQMVGKGNKWSSVPENITDEGLVLDRFDKVLKYIVCNRDEQTNRLVYERGYTPEQVIFDGFFVRFDQRRGVTPFASSLNIFQDLKEIDEAQLLKCKKHALFGIAFGSNSAESGMNEKEIDGFDDDADSGPKYEYELNGPSKIELEPGDKVEMFESKTPSQEYKEYSMLMLRKGFLSFFVPYSLFDSSEANYSSMRQDRAEFRLSVQPTADKIQAALYDIINWVIPYISKEYKLPIKRSAKRLPFEWIPQGQPWLDELKEINAANRRIASGISSVPYEAKQRGLNAYDLLRSQKRYKDAADKNNIIIYGPNGQALTGANQGKINGGNNV